MVAFAAALARVTLTPSAASVPLTRPNLRPGDSIRGYLGQPHLADTVKQLGGNVVLGLPFGVPAVHPRRRHWWHRIGGKGTAGPVKASGTGPA
ncbi:hypothetical protein CP981_19170 [Streptomyces platensis]|nr:hypothetical protein CP981_19170 [Streptomyces platensis]